MGAWITLQVDGRLMQEPGSIARTTERSTDVVVAMVLKAYVAHHPRQIAQIERAVRQAREVGTVPDEEVEARMLSWVQRISCRRQP